jgi:Holliday junction DNA helicase RuvA
VQLETRLEERAEPAHGTRNDVVSALVNLGYKGSQAEKTADLALQRMGTEASFEALFREALKGLRSGA